MKLIVNPHTIQIKKDLVNEKEIDITKCEFEFADEITNDYVKEAYFTFNGTSYKQIIANNECKIPNEVLQEKGQIEIGVVAYLVENEEEIKRYNPSPAYFSTMGGSLKNAENSEPITPSEMEQFEQILEDGLNEVANVNIDANQTSQGGTITITDRDGISKTVYVYNGEKGDKGDTGAKGEKGEKGDKGDKGEQGIQGIQGIPGKDGLNGQDGKDGKDGKDGVDGQPGTPGADGKDGQDGADATINGVNTLTIEAGSNISLDQQGSTMTISATGGSGGTSDYEDLDNLPTINNVKLIGNKTTSDLGIDEGLITLTYGTSTWQEFLDAFNSEKLVYCKSGNGSDPGNAYKPRMSALTYVQYDNGYEFPPTHAEFHYRVSRSSHTTANQTDKVFVYKITNSNVWSYEERQTGLNIEAGNNISLNLNQSGSEITINSLEEYSTTNEVVIGKWINGKPIYRKVLWDLLTSTNVTYSSGISNVDILTDLRAMYIFKNSTENRTEMKPVPFGAVNSNYAQQIQFNKPANEIIVKSGGNVILNGSIYIIMEYTKTTD